MEVSGRVEEAFDHCYSWALTWWAGGCPVPTQTPAVKQVNWGVWQEFSHHFPKTVVLIEEPRDLTGGLILFPTCYVTLGSFCNLSEPSFLICLMLETHCPIKTCQGCYEVGQRKFPFYK